MKVYDENGKHYPPPPRRDEPERDRREPEPQEPQQEPVNLTELLAGDA